MKKILILFSIFLWSNPITYAQHSELDSMKIVLRSLPDDTNKLKLLDQMADIAPGGEWELYNEEMGKLANKFMINDTPALRIAGQKYYSINLSNQAFIAAEKGDYKTALDNYKVCIKISTEIGDKRNMALFLSSVGAIYDRQNSLEKALINYHYALNLRKELGNNRAMVQDIIATLINLGALYAKINQRDSCLFYYSEALKLVTQSKLKTHVATMLMKNLGSQMEKENNLDKALEYYKRGLQMSEEIEDKIAKGYNLEGMARIYFARDEMNKAIEFGKQSLAISLQARNPLNIQSAAYILKRIYEKQGNFREAYKMYNLETLYRDSLQRKENQKAVYSFQFQTEYDIKEAVAKAEQGKKDAIAVSELKRQKMVRNMFIGGFGLVLLFATVFLIQRNKISKGKKISDTLLLNILPAEVAEELKTKGSAEARQFEEVTVMFTDFKDFTKITEKLSPAELVAEIHTCFMAFDNIIARYNIEKIKTIGDSYMCASGLPVANPSHAVDVVYAAIEIQEFVKQHFKERKLENKEPFEIRIGIHNGPVVAGIVGVKKFAYDIWGDTVNIASRMESSGEAGKVNISGATYNVVKDKFTCSYRGKILAKNKGEIDMYFVDGIV